MSSFPLTFIFFRWLKPPTSSPICNNKNNDYCDDHCDGGSYINIHYIYIYIYYIYIIYILYYIILYYIYLLYYSILYYIILMPLCYDFSVAFYGVFIHPRPFSMVPSASSSCTLAEKPGRDGEMIVKYYNVRPANDVSWFIIPSNYSYKYHKALVIGVINQLSYLGGPTL